MLNKKEYWENKKSQVKIIIMVQTSSSYYYIGINRSYHTWILLYGSNREI